MPAPRHWPPAVVARVRQFHAEGLHDAAIARRMADVFRAGVQGVREATQVRRRLGLPRNHAPRSDAVVASNRRRSHFGDAVRERVRELVAAGLTDVAVARRLADELGPDAPKRFNVRYLRAVVMGLPPNVDAAREALRESARRALGTKGDRFVFGERRREQNRAAARGYAVESGWPADLPVRCVQVLNALARHGPMTPRQIAAAIGRHWRGERTFVNNRAGRSTDFSLLRQRGLVVGLAGVFEDAPLDRLYLLSADAEALLHERLTHARTEPTPADR